MDKNIKYKLKAHRLGGIKKQHKRDILFFVCALAPFFLWWAITFICNSGGTILLAFQKWNYRTGRFEFAYLENFKSVATHFMKDPDFLGALLRSCWTYVLCAVVTMILPILCTFYIYKKFFMAKFFKVMLFLPSIISPVITILIYKFITDGIVPQLCLELFGKSIVGLISDPNTTYGAVLFYYLFMQIGAGLLVQLGAMNAIDDSQIEAAKLDGCTLLQEFWYIVFAGSYEILLMGFMLGFSFIFTAELGLYTFFGGSADSRTWTVGYMFLMKTLGSAQTDYPFLSAWGLMMSAITIPVTFLIRHLIYKYGPKDE